MGLMGRLSGTRVLGSPAVSSDGLGKNNGGDAEQNKELEQWNKLLKNEAVKLCQENNFNSGFFEGNESNYVVDAYELKYIEKDPRLASLVIWGLLKYWPITNSQKEVMFLVEIEEILETISVVEFQRIMVPLFWRIGCCINSSHFQVAERALLLWSNDQIFNLIGHNREVFLPIIFPALEMNMQKHWNQSVLNLTLSVRDMMSEIDNVLFLTCFAHFLDEKKKESFETEKRKEAWDRLEHAASLQPIPWNTTVVLVM